MPQTFDDLIKVYNIPEQSKTRLLFCSIALMTVLIFYLTHTFCINFFELLELDEYKVYFPLLKSRDRLISHDQIWEKICEYLHWEFIRSV